MVVLIDQMAEQTGQLVGLIGFEANQLSQMVDQTGQWVGIGERKDE